MAKIVDPITGGLSFESREDLSPEIDLVRPEGVNWQFELPREVDFFVVLSRHRTEEDFSYTESFMDNADMLLFEGAGPFSYQQLLFEEISDGSDSALKFYLEDLEKGGMAVSGMKGFAAAKARALHAHRVQQVLLDPPEDHVVSIASEAIVRGSVKVGGGRDLEALILLGRERDLWVLNNLKRIVDGAQKHKKNMRRKVVITRGFAHLRLLRALEYQCEYNPKKAHGSTVVASTVVLPEGAKQMQQILESLD